jgi:hypothetical protein
MLTETYIVFLNAFMKSFIFILLSSIFLSACVYSKSRLGEYYFGFGYDMVDGGKTGGIDGNSLNLSANSPASETTDFSIYFNYGNIESNNTDDSSWELGLDYIYHYDEYMFQNGMFRPFAGIGVSYLSDSPKVRLADDGFTWKFLAGTEILFTDYLSMSIGANFIGLWTDFGENDLSFDVGLTWWINDVHGVAFEYNHAFDQEVDFIGLKYLYSWQ